MITGGPGAGKTALLEMVRRHFGAHVEVLQEAASVVFGGGFPRRSSIGARKSAQRAIFHVQRELESIAAEEGTSALILCDRGTLDGLAYWPGAPGEFLDALQTTLDAELARYHRVLHLRTPPANGGYDHSNPLRIESAEEAARIDERIAHVWRSHPNYVEIANHRDFVDKVTDALAQLQAELPAVCGAERLTQGSAA